MKRLAIIASAVLVLTFTAGPVLAAKPATGEVVSINLVDDPDTNGLSHDDQISVTVSTNAATWLIQVNCYQDGAWVYAGGGIAHYSGSTSETLILRSLSWPSGAAECTAVLRSWEYQGHERLRVMDELDFAVAA